MSSDPEKLAHILKAYNAVCELLESDILSTSTRFYLQQLRELLAAEMANLDLSGERLASA